VFAQTLKLIEVLSMSQVKNEIMLLDMFCMQNEIQNYLDPDWRNKNLRFDQAIIAEVGELLEELDYKWWKNRATDWQNVRMELIDIWHFLMSDYLTRNDEVHINIKRLSAMRALPINKIVEEPIREHVRNEITEWLVSYLSRDSDDIVFFNFFVLCCKVNLTLEDLYVVYSVKNVLNRFRWDNGYKNNAYIKDWMGQEDNSVCLNLAEKLEERGELTSKNLYKELQDMYAGVVLHNTNK
jgi:dimeric dUTPase (all-alpha-NTP-PPase superfamily)